MVKVKICGLTNLEDLYLVDSFKPDFVGFIMYPPSPRYVGKGLENLLQVPTSAQKVVVFVNPTYDEVELALDFGADLIQLHGEEDLSFVKKIGFNRVIKAFRVPKDFSPELLKPFAQTFALLLDTYDVKSYGGTGKTFNWELARRCVEEGYRIFLAGGLTPENVAKAIDMVKPFGIDLSSGVEAKAGKKDKAKLEKLFKVLSRG